MRKLYYGWWVAGIAAIGIACNFSIFVSVTTGIFAASLTADLGWSREQIFLALWWASLPAPFVAPLMGALVDRYGARRVVGISFALLALVLASFYWLTANIYSFYLRYGLLVMLAMGTSNVSFARLISLWFDRRRGLALGVVLAGVGIGGFLWNKLTPVLIGAFEWRGAYVAMAAIVGLLVLPALLLIVRNTPQELGLLPDGEPSSGDAKPALALSGFTLTETARLPHYWLMVGAFFAIGLGIQSIQVNMVPMLTDRGMTVSTATTIAASLWMAIVFGRVTTGWLMDRYFAPHIAVAYLIPPIIGLLLLAHFDSVGIALLAAVCIGVCAGAEIDVIAYLVSRYFGLRFYSRIYGTFYATYGIAAALGPWSAAKASGSLAGGYTPVMWVCAGILLIGGVFLILLPRFEVKRGAH